MLFDLDGTLTDSAPGIIRCIEHAFAAIGRPAPAPEALRDWIGPPLNESFRRQFDGDEGLAQRAIGRYRERYADQGWRENRLIDGIDALLGRIKAAGGRAFVVTSKPARYARQIVEHFELGKLVEAVRGARADGSGADKAELIAGLLAGTGLEPSQTAMIGDRRHDVAGALDNNVSAVGVTWGYGSEAELRAAGADAIVTEVSALERLLLGQ